MTCLTAPRTAVADGVTADRPTVRARRNRHFCVSVTVLVVANRPLPRLLALVLGVSVGIGALVGVDRLRHWRRQPVVAQLAATLAARPGTVPASPALASPTSPSCALRPVDAAWMDVVPAAPPVLPHTPKSLEPRVHFWTRVWGEASEKRTLLVDERRPWVIFADIDCADLYEWGDPAFAKDRCGERITSARKKVTAHLKKTWSKPETLRRYNGNRALAKSAVKNVIGVRGRVDALARAKDRARSQLSHAESLYEAQGVPRLYARAAIVESLWRPEALSRTGAAGVLQFMPITSKKYLFVEDGLVDERLDPLRSSWAAARYLADMNKQLKSWPLTLTAYNTGPARMKRVMKMRRTADLGQIANAGDLGEYGFDGQNYYAQIIAIARLTKDDVFPETVITGRTLKVVEATAFADLVACTSTTTATLAAANPALLAAVRSGEARVPAGYVLQVPDGGAKTALRLDLPVASVVR